MREETFASALDVVMAAGIRTSTTTDRLPNAGIAPSSDRTLLVGRRGFLRPIEVLQVTLVSWVAEGESLLPRPLDQQ
jgi:hypothetical protein